MTQLNEQYLCYEGEDIQNKRNKIKGSGTFFLTGYLDKIIRD